MSESSTRATKLFNRHHLCCLSPGGGGTMHLRSQSLLRHDEFYNAIHTGDARRCRELLSTGVINLQDGDHACCHPKEAVVQTTLPLQFAVMHRQPEIVKLLLGHGADPDCVDIEGKSAIHTLILYWPRCVPKESPVTSQEVAAYHAYLRSVDLICRDTLRRLCAFGGCPNARDNRQQSPLHYAARYNIPSAAKVLLSYGAYRDARDMECMTPTMLAAALGHDCLTVLLDAKANVHLTCVLGKTALHHAVQSRCPQHKRQACVAVLLKAGANPNATDKNGQTALHFACKGLDDAVLTHLLQTGADADIRDADGMNPLHVLLENHSLNHLDVHTILALLDATLSYGTSEASLLASLSMQGLHPLREALLNVRAPPSLQRICRKILRSQLIRASPTADAMEENVARLPLPKSLQRFLLCDIANPIRHIVLTYQIFT